MRLITANLMDKSRPMRALSYIWGTGMASTKATLNGIPVDIIANLDCAIRHLRFTLHKRCLWIDAVSMDQTNVQERNHQVQIMGHIYGTAQSVIVWLGPADQTDLYVRAVLGAMQLHFSDGSPSTATLFDYICSVITLLDEHLDHVDDPKDLVLSILDLIIDRPWFHRMWVEQELALATRATVHIGSFSFPWQLESPKRSCNRHFASQLCHTLHLSATDPRDKVSSSCVYRCLLVKRSNLTTQKQCNESSWKLQPPY
jgi:hypothetical protein